MKPPRGAVTDEALRIDLWLWRSRSYRSRSLAAAAVDGGRVHVNGARVRRSRPVRPGDRLRLSLPGAELEVEVRGVPARRGPPPEAAACYREHARTTRGRHPGAVPGVAPPGRPASRDRRRLRALKSGR